MKPGDGSKWNDKAPLSPTTPPNTTSSSQQHWDAHYHYQFKANLSRQEEPLDSQQQLIILKQAEFEPPQRRDRPRQPYRCALRYPSRNNEADSLLNNIKISIPAFKGLYDPDLYLKWEMKVNKIFECYDFPEVKKVQLAFMEFTGYAATWWEFQQHQCRRDRYHLIDTWQEMKDGIWSIEEYHKELETALNRIGKEETLVATIKQYIEGINPDISCKVELRDFESIEAMIHCASIVEQQLRDGHRRPMQSTPTRTPWSAPQPSCRPEYSSPIPNRINPTQPGPSAQPQNGMPGRACDVQCHNCRGWGHFQAQCLNCRILLLTEQNELESASEEELDEAEVVWDATQSLYSLPVDEIEDEKLKQAHTTRLWPLTPKDINEDQRIMQEKFKEKKEHEKRAESKFPIPPGQPVVDPKNSKGRTSASKGATKAAHLTTSSPSSSDNSDPLRGPVTRLRAKKLQRYFQCYVQKKLEDDRIESEVCKLVNMTSIEGGTDWRELQCEPGCEQPVAPASVSYSASEGVSGADRVRDMLDFSTDVSYSVTRSASDPVVPATCLALE
ncbi:hypothetical protein C2S52_013941 [Perilla frutescens var. hirtella]|nr:hypothetical protein C2S52_013941 [Perilla frutescens var. hirtella]